MKTKRRTWIMVVWRGMPTLTVFALLFLPQILSGTGVLSPVLTPLPLLAVYYWSMEHPKRIGWQLPLFAGLFHDVLADLTLGPSALLWLAFRVAVGIKRRDIHEGGFIVTWVFGSLCILGLFMVHLSILNMFYHMTLPLTPMMLQWAMGVLLYPALHAALHDLEKRFHRRYWFILKSA